VDFLKSLFKKLIDILFFWRTPQPPPSLPSLKHWYEQLETKPYSTHPSELKPITFFYEKLSLPPVLESEELVIFNGVRSPGSKALHIEQIVFYGSKSAFRMLGLYLIAAALRIHHTKTVQLNCTNKEVSPCRGLKIGKAIQSKLEKDVGLAPGILTEWSWTPSIPEGNLTQWVRELDHDGFPKDHLPSLRLGSEETIYDEQHRPRSDQAIFVHLKGTLISLCWLGRGLLNFALEDHPCHTWSLLNYGGHNSLAPESAEIRFVTAEGADIPSDVAKWLAHQMPASPTPSVPAPPTPTIRVDVPLRGEESAPTTSPATTQEVQ
jgi:hypothetical protein